MLQKQPEVIDHDGFEFFESKDEYISSVQHFLLHQSWIQSGVLHGKSINDLIVDDDPTVYIRQLKEIGSSLRTNLPISVTVFNSEKQTNSVRPYLSTLLNN